MQARLGGMNRDQRASLRALLCAATAIAGSEHRNSHELAALVAAAPIDRLGPAAALHRVSGCVLDGLAGVDGVPVNVRDELMDERDRAAFHHLVTVGALSEISTCFDDAGLTWVVMKGPVLADLLYAHAGDRRYGDLDLLVDRRDFGAAVDALEELGYRHTIKNWALAEAMLAGQITMSSPTMSIDLHWHLHYSREDRRPFAIDPDEMLARARRRSISGVLAPILDPVDQIVNLGFHAARSGGHRLVWLKDIERAMAVDQPDPVAIHDRARSFGCGPSVGLVFDRTQRILGLTLPGDLPASLASPALLAADRAVCALRHPIQFHERETSSRTLVRSVRGSTLASISEAPSRAVRRLRNRLDPPRPNETSDLAEKRSYFAAVAGSKSSTGRS